MRNVPSYALYSHELIIQLASQVPPLIYLLQNIATKPEKKTDDGNTIRIVLPFKDQIAANAVLRQLRDLSNPKIHRNKMSRNFAHIDCIFKKKRLFKKFSYKNCKKTFLKNI